MRALMIAALLMLAGVGASSAIAQVGPGGAINPQRDCQTIVTCNFRKNGSYRGCLSSYSCRQCRMVSVRCPAGDRRKTCQEFSCGWGA